MTIAVPVGQTGAALGQRPWLSMYAMDEEVMTFGQLLHFLHDTRKRMTEQAFAGLMGVNRATLASWEADGPIRNEIAMVRKAAKILGVPVAKLSRKRDWVLLDDMRVNAAEAAVLLDPELPIDFRDGLSKAIRSMKDKPDDGGDKEREVPPTRHTA